MKRRFTSGPAPVPRISIRSSNSIFRSCKNRPILRVAFKQLLGAPNIASKEWIYRQYDQYVRTNTLVASGADAAVIRIKGTKKALALTVDGNSRYCFLDPYVGGVLAVVEAARNLACVGARPVGLTDCLNFGSPENPEVMWQFAQVIHGMRDACDALKVPVVSGNVSFYNETDGVPIFRRRPLAWSAC